MSEFDIRIETILDGLLAKANKSNVELAVTNTFRDDDRRHLSCIIQRVNDNSLGMITVNVDEYPDEPVVFFIFNSDLYNYAKMEGFDLSGMLEGGFTNKVFIKCHMREFFDRMLDDD